MPTSKATPGVAAVTESIFSGLRSRTVCMNLKRALVDGAPVHVHHIVVDAGAITDLDYAAGRTMRTLLHDLGERGTTLIIARASQFLRADLARHGIAELVGEDRIFATLHEGVAAARQIQSSVIPTGAESLD